MFDEACQAFDPASRESVRAVVEAAKAEERRAEAVALLRGAYEPDHPRFVYEALRELLTYPEFSALPAPPATAVGAHGEALVPRGNYASMLGGTFAYPFSSSASVTVLLVGGLLFGGAMGLLRIGGCLLLVCLMAVLGYLVAYWFNVVLESAQGKRVAPGWPESGDLWEYAGCFLRWWLATAIVSTPAIVLFSLWLAEAEQARSAAVLAHPAFIGFFIAALAGTIYYPMALMLAAFGGTWWAPFNLKAGLSAIARLRSDYFLCVFYFVATVAVEMAVEGALVRAVGTQGWLPIAVRVGAAWLTFTMYVVQMRALGLLYYAREKELDW